MTNQIIKQAPKYKLIFKDELWEYINDHFGHQKASYHTNNIMKSVDKLLDQAITQAVEEAVESLRMEPLVDNALQGTKDAWQIEARNEVIRYLNYRIDKLTK